MLQLARGCLVLSLANQKLTFWNYFREECWLERRLFLRRLLGHQVRVGHFQRGPSLNAGLGPLDDGGRQHQLARALSHNLLCLILAVKSEVLAKISEAVFLLKLEEKVLVELEEGLELVRRENLV